MNGLEISEVKRSELERTIRFDSEYFLKRYRAIDCHLQRLRLKSIADLVHVSDGNHFSISGEFRDVGVPYYRGQDVTGHFFVEKSEPKCITQVGFDAPHMRRSHLKKGDVLLSIVGTIGELSLVTQKKPATCSCKLAILRSESKEITPEFLALFLKSRYGREQVNRQIRGAIQKSLLLEDMDQVFIPRFEASLEHSLQLLVQKSLQAISVEGNSRAQAEELLLESMGLTDPLPGDENTSSKSFSSSFASSGRLDAEFYHPKYDELFERIHANAEYVKPVSGLETFNSRGLQPVYEEHGSLAVINSRHILEDGLDYNSFEKTGDGFWETQKKARVKRNDILVYTTGANIGRSQPYLSDDPALASNHVNILRIQDEDPLYVAFVMNSLIGRMQTERLSAGTAQAELYPKDISQFVIPFVSKKKQREIVDLLVEAREKKADSFQCLEKAKRAVEIAIEQGEEAAMAYLEGRNYVEQAVVHELGEQAPYFSIDAIRRWLVDQKMNYKPDTVKSYLSRQKKAGKIFDAGRGWYSSLSEPYHLDTAPVEKLVGELKEAFPLLDFACWSTAQLNDMLRHQLAKHVQFAYVERDAMESVASWLRENGYRPTVNPGKKERQSFVIEDHSVVVLPLTTKSPHQDGFSSFEKILVDVLSDCADLSIINIPEFIEGAKAAISSNLIDIASLYSYSARREVDISEVENGNIIH